MGTRLIAQIMGYLAAVLFAAAMGSIVQTQFNLAALTAMGVNVPVGTWLLTTGQDLVSFAPAYAIVVAVALLLAFPVAGILSRWLPHHRRALFMLAGGSGVLAAILLMNTLLPMTLIAATRYAAGTAALALAGAIGGWLHASMTARNVRTTPPESASVS